MKADSAQDTAKKTARSAADFLFYLERADLRKNETGVDIIADDLKAVLHDRLLRKTFAEEARLSKDSLDDYVANVIEGAYLDIARDKFTLIKYGGMNMRHSDLLRTVESIQGLVQKAGVPLAAVDPSGAWSSEDVDKYFQKIIERAYEMEKHNPGVEILIP